MWIGFQWVRCWVSWLDPFSQVTEVLLGPEGRVQTADLELEVFNLLCNNLLPQFPKYWDHRHVSSCQAALFFVFVNVVKSRNIKNLKCYGPRHFPQRILDLWKYRRQYFLSDYFIPCLRPRPT